MKICQVFGWMAGFVALATSDVNLPPGTKLRNLCSSDLARAYALVCDGPEGEDSAATDMMIKRHDSLFDSLMPLAEWFSDRTGLSSRDHSLTMTSSRVSKRQSPGVGGLVDECCLKSCYVEELLNYCP